MYVCMYVCMFEPSSLYARMFEALKCVCMFEEINRVCMFEALKRVCMPKAYIHKRVCMFVDFSSKKQHTGNCSPGAFMFTVFVLCEGEYFR